MNPAAGVSLDSSAIALLDLPLGWARWRGQAQVEPATTTEA